MRKRFVWQAIEGHLRALNRAREVDEADVTRTSASRPRRAAARNSAPPRFKFALARLWRLALTRQRGSKGGLKRPPQRASKGHNKLCRIHLERRGGARRTRPPRRRAARAPGPRAARGHPAALQRKNGPRRARARGASLVRRFRPFSSRAPQQLRRRSSAARRAWSGHPEGFIYGSVPPQRGSTRGGRFVDGYGLEVVVSTKPIGPAASSPNATLTWRRALADSRPPW